MVLCIQILKKQVSRHRVIVCIPFFIKIFCSWNAYFLRGNYGGPKPTCWGGEMEEKARTKTKQKNNLN
jgi:hypothetical protein